MASLKPIPGIMTVNSDVIKPDELSRKDFDDWYCDEHIPDVVDKSGVQAAYRYEHMNNGSSLARRLGFLTIYPMPDINFMTTPEFRSLEGQSPGPNRTRIFEKAEFDTRSYELVQVHSALEAPLGPAPFLIYTTFSNQNVEEVDRWFRTEHIPFISGCPGYVRSSWYNLATNSLLSSFERSFPEAPKWLAIHEFEGEGVPWEEVKKVHGEMEMRDFEGWELKRVFEKKGWEKI